MCIRDRVKDAFTHAPTRFSAESVSCKQTLRKTTFNVASVNANSAGDVKKTSATSVSKQACWEKYAPIRGPTMNPTENATPINAYTQHAQSSFTLHHSDG